MVKRIDFILVTLEIHKMALSVEAVEFHLNFIKFTPVNMQKTMVERSIKGLVQ